jgi:hypothetical protein
MPDGKPGPEEQDEPVMSLLVARLPNRCGQGSVRSFKEA